MKNIIALIIFMSLISGCAIEIRDVPNYQYIPNYRHYYYQPLYYYKFQPVYPHQHYYGPRPKSNRPGPRK